jgi:hypothetical protein
MAVVELVLDEPKSPAATKKQESAEEVKKPVAEKSGAKK